LLIIEHFAYKSLLLNTLQTFSCQSLDSNRPGIGEGVTACESKQSRGVHGAKPRHHTSLAHRFFNLRDPVRTLQHFARFRSIGSADNPVAFHEVDEVCGAAIADAQAALQKGSRGFAKFD